MKTDWSREEVEATVSDYFEMLDCELRGLEYNKTSHRRNLSKLLDQRSDGAIERKHQNISAILIELGFPYIPGYKPLSNYQHVLRQAVVARLMISDNLKDFVGNQVLQIADLPLLDDILNSWVEPPLPIRENIRKIKYPPAPYLAQPVDYIAREANNTSLGKAGEQFVILFERARLIKANKENLASKVEQISLTEGASAGFDILSFDESGKERFIEVKTTAFGASTPFFVTQNEVSFSRREENQYFLYRTFNFRKHAKLFTKQGSIDKSFELEPSQYLAKII